MPAMCQEPEGSWTRVRGVTGGRLRSGDEQAWGLCRLTLRRSRWKLSDRGGEERVS